jgi:acetyltransferase
MWRYSKQLRSLYETPTSADDPGLLASRRERGANIIERVATSGRTLLTEFESKQILETYGIPTVPTQLAASADEAAREATNIGFPVVLKVHSEIVTHKTDVGGVRLHLANEGEVREAFDGISSSVTAKAGRGAFLGVTVQPMARSEGYELILGSSIDSQFGPVLLFGSGGQLVEVYRDRALALPPLNTTLAKRLMEQTKIFRALEGVRGRKAVALPELETLLVRFSELVVDQPRLREIDINPLLASSTGLVALDARMTLHGPEVADAALPRPAIRRYPAEYIWAFKLRGGTSVTVRPIRPEDEPLMVKLHEALSESTVYHRYFQALRLDARIVHERLVRNCFVDYDRQIALVAERIESGTGQRELLGVGRLSRQRDKSEAELGIVVADKWQGGGLGTELMRRLLQVARAEKIRRIVAHILSENTSMDALVRHFHFVRVPDDDPISLTATLDLEDFPPSA